jgi:polygalacturonase
MQGDNSIPNNDGIDIDSSSHVIVNGCTVDTADDAICIKTTLLDTPCHDIYIYNCTLQSKSSALKIGSESLSDIYNIVFDTITISRASRAMTIQPRDTTASAAAAATGGSAVYNITFSNIIIDEVKYPPDTSWWGAGEVISLSLLPRGGASGSITGSMHDVYFRNITAYSADSGVVVVGNVEDEEEVYGTTRIRNVVIEGLDVVMRRWWLEHVSTWHNTDHNNGEEKGEEEEEGMYNNNNKKIGLKGYLDLRPSAVGIVPLDDNLSHVAVYLEYCQGVNIQGMVVNSGGVYVMDGTTEGIDLDGLVVGRVEE